MADAGLFGLPFAAPRGDGLEHPATVTAVTPCRRSRNARAASGWTGGKRWITDSPVSDFVVTLCRTGDRELSLILVPAKDTHGVRVGLRIA